MAQQASSSLFEQREALLQLPDDLLSADEYAACSILNGSLAGLTAGERKRLGAILEQWQLALHEAQHRVLAAVDAWSLEKSMVDGLSAEAGTPGAAAVAERARAHAELVRQVVRRDRSKRVVSVAYGEDASVDVGFDELWFTMSQAQEGIRGFFRARR